MIAADVALISAVAVGFPVRVNVSCLLERDAPGYLRPLHRGAQGRACRDQRGGVMGEADFTFTVVARSMKHIRELVRPSPGRAGRLIEPMPRLRLQKSSFVLRGPTPEVLAGPHAMT
ncbi:MAG: hypothetical protein WKF75_11365 [Singulisphaera sp.]